MRRIVYSSLVFIAAAVISASPVGAQTKAPDSKTIEHGQKIYTAQKCSMCHSIGGKGGKVSALDDVGSRLSLEDIRQWLISPRVMAEKTKSTKKPLMPEYTKLSKEDLNAIVAYMASLKKK